MRILGMDLGSRTLGIAMSDTNESIASMKETYRFEEDDYDSALDHTLEYIDQYNIKTVVLGLPKHMNGDIGIRGEISLEFKEILENERKDVTVVLIDERLTTVISQRSMTMMNTSKKKKKGIVDQIAAQQILQSYLDSKKR